MFKNKLSKASFAALLAFSALPVTAAHATTEGTSLTTQVKGADVSYKAALEDAAALTYANDKNVSFSSLPSFSLEVLIKSYEEKQVVLKETYLTNRLLRKLEKV